MRVLVAYGTKRGGTEGVAEILGEGLRLEGHNVDVRSARGLRLPMGYDAVLVGGALYANRWHRDVRRFVRRNATVLRQIPVWFFSSGPLDASAVDGEIPPTAQVAKLMEAVSARGHKTFGGRLTPDAKGFPASAMAKDKAGDWRDPDHIQGWARTVSHELSAGVPR